MIQSELKPKQKKPGPCKKNKRQVDSRIEGVLGLATDWLLKSNRLRSQAGCEKEERIYSFYSKCCFFIPKSYPKFYLVHPIFE